jgi:hypothetical protein
MGGCIARDILKPVISNPALPGKKSALFGGREEQISLFVRNDNGGMRNLLCRYMNEGKADFSLRSK